MTFDVKAKDKRTGKELTLSVTRNGTITTQAEAEALVSGLPGSHGGTHPGFEVIPAAAAPAEEAK